MKHTNVFKLLLGAMAAFLFLSGCVPVQLLEPTATPTTVARAPTNTPTTTPSPAPSSTPTATATPSATATATETPTSTATPIPPSPTATATSTPVPPTATPRPTNTPLPPTATFTPTPVVITAWKGEYFNNVSLSSPPVFIRNDETIDFSLPPGVAPGPGMPSENWSARWTRTINFARGNYRFHVTVDDGARLYVGEDLLIDKWFDQSATEYSANLFLSGDVPIQLDYYNHTGSAVIKLSWEKVTSYADWKGSYYANQDLSGSPVFQRNDAHIDFNFGTGSPRADIPVNHFSIRWTRHVDFNPAGIYHFHLASDDGARLYIDGQEVINNWQNGPHESNVTVYIPAGSHHLRVDYYEVVGPAYIQFTWNYVAATNTPTPVPTPPRVAPTNTPLPPPPPPTNTPVPTPPRVAPTNTPSSAPGGGSRPTIKLKPGEGHLGETFEVRGHHWPPNTTVNIVLLKPVSQPVVPAPTAQARVDGSGVFVASVDVPKTGGWEAMADAIVEAQDTSGQDVARERFHILPDLSPLSFTGIPATEQRFALQTPTFVVIDSEQAWTQMFGSEPPPVQPGVNWKRQIVIGAFLGPRASGAQLSVSSIVQRTSVVSIRLANTGQPQGSAPRGAGEISRVLIRVKRDEINTNYKGPAAKVTYEFLDERGQLLAQGPAGSVQAASAVVALEEKALPLPEVAAPAPDIQVTELAAPAAEVPAQPATRSAASRAWFIVWLVLASAVVVAAIAGVSLYFWRRRRGTPQG